MKSFFDLLKDKKFAFYLIVLIVFLIWMLWRGFLFVAIVFIALTLGAIIINLWKTR